MNWNKTYLLLVDGKPSLQFTSLEEAKTYVLNQSLRCTFHVELPDASAPSKIWEFDFEKGDWILQS